MDILVPVFVCLFVCLYGYRFLSGGKKDSGVKLRMLVRLLSRSGFCLGQLWPRASQQASNEGAYKSHLGKIFAFSPQFVVCALRSSLGSRNCAPYGGICVLLANALVCLSVRLSVSNFAQKLPNGFA